MLFHITLNQDEFYNTYKYILIFLVLKDKEHIPLDLFMSEKLQE